MSSSTRSAPGRSGRRQSVMPMAKQPEQSYILWFTQRVGSTLLAQALEDTSVAGRPREWLNASSAVAVMKQHGAATAGELRSQLWRVATTSNGVLGIKYGMVPKLHEELVELMASVDPERTGRSHDAWQRFFPNCSHWLLTRRDKVRLAISWWRAIKTEEWHRPNRADTSVGMVESKPPGSLIEKYDFHAIQYLLDECSAREGAIRRQLDAWTIEPVTIFYEDLVAEFETTVRSVLELLRVPHARAMTIPRPAFEALADEINDAWYERFLADRPRLG
jgi:trehalose 2-sulfotransferase